MSTFKCTEDKTWNYNNLDTATNHFAKWRNNTGN